MRVPFRFPVFLAALAAAAGVRAEDAIQFAPPPVPMLNLTANDAVHTNTIDYMKLTLGDFDLHCGNFGMGVMERVGEKWGWNRLAAVQFIIGEGALNLGEDLGDSSKFNMTGMGVTAPINIFFDPLSEDTDDASLPIYAGVHVGMTMLAGSYSMPYWELHWPSMTLVEKTMTTSILTTSLAAGWQAGVQAGINLGPHLKFVPYVDVSHEVFMGVMTSISNSFVSDTSSSGNLGPMPISLMPGFDLVMRRYGLSLGGAYKTMEQDSGDMKVFNLHFRFTKKFKSICG